MGIRRERLDNLGIVTLDNPPVNAIGQAERQGLLEAVHWAEQERLDRVIVIGAGRAFAAGADAREFDGPPLEPHLPDVLNAIERSHVPWVAAINGVALGGGAEIALACRMRIMAPEARIGLPEVTLGVIPGAGGTQRLPRLVGLERALEMVSLGKPITAETALATGLIHEIDPDPVDAAYLVNSEALGCIVPVWELPSPAPDAKVLDRARATVARKSRGQIAPERAIDAVEFGLSAPFQDALAVERDTFLRLRNGAQAKALRHVFFAESAAARPPASASDPVPVARVAVVGGGTMGAGIAYALVNAGLSVVLLEADDAGLARARSAVDTLVEASLKRGLITPDGAADRQARLTVSLDYGDAATADLAIEAVLEDMGLKRSVFSRLEDALPPHAILASNTSYLDVNAIAAGLQDPSRMLGLHFFAPAHIMKLLEIVRGDATSPKALATGFQLARMLRKTPVVSGVCDGFIGNRILARYREAADTILMDASTPWEIDDAMVAFGYAMGPYEAQDLSGLDIAHANRRRQDATRDPNRRYCPIADRMVELGKLGRKTGAGWYRYPGGGGKVEDPIVADLALEEAHLAGVTRVDMTADQISERLVLAMINEAADILHEGIAASARDIDLVTILGYGFPRWRGGLMHHADSLGVDAVVERLEELEREDPIAWAISPVLRTCSERGIPLVEYTSQS